MFPILFAKKCNHLNGKYLITDRFNEYVFIKSGSKKLQSNTQIILIQE